ncbi:MAG: class I SAM-dependent methyltransferase [bacterium]|nr:class I SAM-dependent methyltransferase [bacterium]
MNKELYKEYVSTHMANLYSKTALNDARMHFATWNSYFGKLLPNDKNAKILDAGCGTGDFLFWLKYVGFNKIRGVDISAEQILAGKRAGFSDIYEGDIFKELPKNINSYDTIFARDVLEHFGKNDAINFCKQAALSLVEDGSFIIQTTNAESLLWGKIRHGDFTHEQAFTESSIRQLLMIAGFKNVLVFPQRPIIRGIKSFFRYVIWMFFELFLRFYLVAETGSFRGILTQNLLVLAKR